MKVIIETADNGYIIKSYSLDPDSQKDILEEKQVLEIDEVFETQEEDCNKFRQLCYTLMDMIGFNNSKHNKYRLNIEVEKQED